MAGAAPDPAARLPGSPAEFLDYKLPSHLIAQHPADRRDCSRLLVVDRSRSTLEHRIFHELPELLKANDLLILNDTRVLPARLLGRRARTGGRWEGLFLRALPDGLWELLCQTRGRLRAGETIEIEPGPLSLELVSKTEEGHWLVLPRECFRVSAPELLEQHGHTPLPPYIRKGRGDAADRERYQTVYAHEAGALAAPTAGLHFTEAVFERLDARGIARAFVTLHIGLGTFQPISADIGSHRIHAEWGRIPEPTVLAIETCRKRGGRAIAVGTTSVRVLESVAASGPIRAWSGETDLFIRPPYRFGAVDALITNFHLPRSTLLHLVAAFAGVELTWRAYRTAVEQSYRFYSYGDAMLVL
jgi:S-adenosylmethionine:tRNA ribosyltransferase-isomerase